MRTINLVAADDECDCCTAYTIKLPDDFLDTIGATLPDSDFDLHFVLSAACMYGFSQPEFIETLQAFDELKRGR